MSSCGHSTEPTPEEPPTEPIIDEMQPDPPVDPVDTSDADESRKFVCVNVNNLRIRNAPAGEILYETIGNEKREKYAQRIAYEYFEEAEADGYRWLRIGEDKWIATKPEWITESYYGENFSLDDPNARIEFVEGDGWAPYLWEEIPELLRSLGQDETQVALSMFLKKTMPGILYDYFRLIDFDVDNLTDEMRNSIFHQLFFHGFDMLINLEDYPELNHVREGYSDVLRNNCFPSSNPDYTWDFCYGNAGILPVILEEHMNYLSNKYYGKMIDFRTCTDMLLYDPIDHAFAVLYPYGYGYGAGSTFLYIESYSIKGDIITATVVPMITLYGDKVEDNESLGIFSPNAEVTVKITESGDYQLLKVHALDEAPVANE